VGFIELLALYIDLPNSLSAKVRFARALRAANANPPDEPFTMKLKDLIDKTIDV
jgi:hypothetical protein